MSRPSRPGPDRDLRIAQISLLDDPTRRRLFDRLRTARRAMTREEAARAAGITIPLAAFHLDKLLAGGLLEASYARPAGRAGPGAGRPAKRYRLADEHLSVSIPQRRYDLAGSVFAEALRTLRRGEAPADAALRVAKARGIRAGRDGGAGDGFTAARRALAADGFEPEAAGRDLTLRNCPFRSLAVEDPDLVCRMNRAYVGGVLRGAGATGARAILTRVPGNCCVTVRR